MNGEKGKGTGGEKQFLCQVQMQEQHGINEPPEHCQQAVLLECWRRADGQNSTSDEQMNR